MLSKKLIPRKETLDKLIVPAIVTLVGITAFGLGRLSALQEQKGELKIYTSGEGSVLGTSTNAYVASKGGEKYYLPTCPGAQRIKEENRIWFPSAEVARSVGFAPAAQCPGL